MRGLAVVIAILALIAVVLVVGIGLFVSTESGEVDDGLINQSVDIEMIGGKGPGFDVETGSMSPGEANDVTEEAAETELASDPAEDLNAPPAPVAAE